MQKLNSYSQSPNQDVRSFCSEMRKLFSEADSYMSSSMKLEFLLAKVNPIYRLDLLKQKPKDPTEFEAMARDIENIYLAQDSNIRSIISQLNQNEPCDSTLSSSCIMKNGILHKLIALTPKSKLRLSVPYLPSSMVRSLLTAIHDDPFQGGHFSVDKMLSKIRTRYWWSHMRQDVQSHVQACVSCQQYNYSRQKKPGHLQPIPPVATPFSIIGMDFCGPFVESPRENKYVLVVTDLFTHFVTASPLLPTLLKLLH
ncbi:unnamed protein product [Rotaria socialis]|uniref:Integrase zinc-binding domain-containing protein n=1 Tax=Rotaria socialis TaxID=392032 RepID=A0A818Y681_9BILA|nr:unnamed protein product [Rotaria socialis]CAF4619085.1 unnamed protein product [Rotaria socialis]